MSFVVVVVVVVCIVIGCVEFGERCVDLARLAWK
jgi:hypothetical protein